MRRVLPVAMLTSSLAACGTVGDVLVKTGQILMDPSIQVGANDEQPSLVGLSLYAAPDVNPNPASLPDASAPDDAAGKPDDGPYQINLKTASRLELIDSLRGMLEELEEGRPSLHPLMRVDRGSAKLHHPAAPPVLEEVEMVEAPPAVLVDLVSPDFLPGRQFGAGLPVVEQGLTGTPLPLALPPATASRRLGGEADNDDGRALGQYNQAHSLPSAEPAPAPRGAATPIAFKVLQLKDDSLLLNADHELLAKDLKKALGSTYITQDDYVLLPGQFKFIDFARIDEDTRYVAIVADFHDQNGAVWKQTFRLDDPKGRKYALLMTLSGNQVAIKDESYRPPQPRPTP